MAGLANLNIDVESISTGIDSVVIRRKGGRIIGGRTLNVDGWNDEHVKAGHIIIRGKTEDNEDDWKPMPVSSGAYAALPEGYKYAGVLVRTVPKSDPRASIQYDGEINDKALPYSIDSIRAALKQELPTLVFDHD